jgi:hypothetical protein
VIVAAISISGSLSAMALEDREAELAQMAIESADRISTGIGASHKRPKLDLTVLASKERP